MVAKEDVSEVPCKGADWSMERIEQKIGKSIKTQVQADPHRRGRPTQKHGKEEQDKDGHESTRRRGWAAYKEKSRFSYKAS